MSTAHRPTFNSAAGGKTSRDNPVSRMYSVKDMPHHLTLKTRQIGQGSAEELSQRDFRAELERKESIVAEKRRRGEDDESLMDHSKGGEEKKLRLVDAATAALDADDKDDEDEDEVGSDSEVAASRADPLSRPAAAAAVVHVESDDSDSDDSDDDDQEALMRELEKIKREKAEEKARLDAEAAEEAQRVRQEALLRGNPLMNQETRADFAVQRRWDDDVVFKNCTRGVSEKPEKRFINDTLRSDFHRKFMNKYVQ